MTPANHANVAHTAKQVPHSRSSSCVSHINACSREKRRNAPKITGSVLFVISDITTHIKSRQKSNAYRSLTIYAEQTIWSRAYGWILHFCNLKRFYNFSVQLFDVPVSVLLSLFDCQRWIEPPGSSDQSLVWTPVTDWDLVCMESATSCLCVKVSFRWHVRLFYMSIVYLFVTPRIHFTAYDLTDLVNVVWSRSRPAHEASTLRSSLHIRRFPSQTGCQADASITGWKRTRWRYTKLEMYCHHVTPFRMLFTAYVWECAESKRSNPGGHGEIYRLPAISLMLCMTGSISVISQLIRSLVNYCINNCSVVGTLIRSSAMHQHIKCLNWKSENWKYENDHGGHEDV